MEGEWVNQGSRENWSGGQRLSAVVPVTAKKEVAVGLGDVVVKVGFLCGGEICVIVSVEGLTFVLKRPYVTEVVDIGDEGKEVVGLS